MGLALERWKRFVQEKKALRESPIMDITAERTSVASEFSSDIASQFPHAPRYIVLNDGRKIKAFSNEQVISAGKDLINETIDAHLEFYFSNKQNFPLKITEEAFEKTMSCARMVADTYASPLEISMHLLKKTDATQDSITDVMIAHNQYVTPSSCESLGYVQDMNYRRKKNYAYAGWSHSHGNSAVFHSPTDDMNLFSLLGTARAPVQQISVPSLPGITVPIRCVPSLVVNMKGDSHAAMGISYREYALGTTKQKILDGVHISLSGNIKETNFFDYDSLQRVVRREVHPR